ncbi:hypothetical protein BSKO_09752 [Bryopsis sp. KO-2023]|nr:hypothetical protein BSKO_09752 [Bryopsis sp. KO-2023]
MIRNAKRITREARSPTRDEFLGRLRSFSKTPDAMQALPSLVGSPTRFFPFSSCSLRAQRLSCNQRTSKASNTDVGRAATREDTPREEGIKPVALAAGLGGFLLAFSTDAEAGEVLGQVASNVGPLSTGATAVAAGFGAFAFVYTFILTGRFLMTVFPAVERKRKEMPYSLLVSSTQPALEPLRKLLNSGVKLVPMQGDGEIDITPMIALGLLSLFHEAFFGSSGVLLPLIPDESLQSFLEFVLVVERGILIPGWLLASLRWTNII